VTGGVGPFHATKISQRELRNDSGTIMRRVEQGERFTVTRNGIPHQFVPRSSSP
jgi:antitoxin (DNA-binding transcriptional repressor) of toxin-antitoxin stability system